MSRAAFAGLLLAGLSLLAGCGEGPTAPETEAGVTLEHASADLRLGRVTWRTGLMDILDRITLEAGQCAIENRRPNGRVLVRYRRAPGAARSSDDTRLFSLTVQRRNDRLYRATCRIGLTDAHVDAMMAAVWPGGRGAELWRHYRPGAARPGGGGANDGGATGGGQAAVSVGMNATCGNFQWVGGVLYFVPCELENIPVNVSPCDDPFEQDWDGQTCQCSLMEGYCDPESDPNFDEDIPGDGDDGPSSGGGGSNTGDDGPPPDDCQIEEGAPPCDAPGDVPQEWYNELNRAEKLVCVSNPPGCLQVKAAREVAEAAAWAANLGLNPTRPGRNDQTDAYRHARWTAEITHRVSADYALRFSDAHEWNSEHPCETQMDLHNNRAGIDIAEANMGGGALNHLILEWISLGRLRVMAGRGANFSC